MSGEQAALCKVLPLQLSSTNSTSLSSPPPQEPGTSSLSVPPDSPAESTGVVLALARGRPWERHSGAQAAAGWSRPPPHTCYRALRPADGAGQVGGRVEVRAGGAAPDCSVGEGWLGSRRALLLGTMGNNCTCWDMRVCLPWEPIAATTASARSCTVEKPGDGCSAFQALAAAVPERRGAQGPLWAGAVVCNIGLQWRGELEGSA